jgi:drug/metabolite transporter (DMT)-like permease
MRSWLFLFSCNLMWALQFTSVKLVADQAGALFTVWGPMTLATIMLYPLVRLEKREAHPRPARGWKDVGLFLLLAAAGSFPAQVVTTWGTRMSLATNAALLQLTLPVSTAILAFIFLDERMNAVRWASFALAMVGVLMCSDIDFKTLNFGSSYLAGNALVFVGTLGSAFYNSYGKKVLERFSPMEMLFYTYLAMFFLMTPLVVAQERDVFARIPSFTLSTWMGFILLTFFHNYLSMVLFLKALKVLDAIQAALSNYLISFFGIPIAAIFLHERLKSWAIVGGILVLGSTLLITLVGERKRAVVKN